MLAVDAVGDGETRRRSWVELQKQKDFERCEGTRGGSPEAALNPDVQEFGCGPPLEDVAVSTLRGAG
jgi:hypothetical protein